jgi:lysophospholipase L1-like esterase
MTDRRSGVLLGLELLLAALLVAPAAARTATERWTASWASAQMIAGTNEALPAGSLDGATLRQVVRLSVGGSRLRVLLSNRFGTTPLEIARVSVAIATGAGASTIVAGSEHALRVAGRDRIVIAPGAESWSDPVALPTRHGADLAISMHVTHFPAVQTSHPGSRATSFMAPGDQTQASALQGATTTAHWFAIAGVSVSASGHSVVVIGDSITDGYGVPMDSNQRWPDRLAERFRTIPALADWGVVNSGIGGNRVLADGLGPRLIDRFDRDVLSQPGVRAAIVLEGVNDLGVMTRDQAQPAEVHQAMVARIEAAFRDLADRAHRRGVKLIGGTITPFVGSGYYHPGAETEADRQAINTFIRTSGVFDGVIDFDAALRDPAHPDQLLPAFDSGDHLHPSPLGYRAMGNAVPLSLFTPAPAGNAPAIALTFDDMPAHGPLPPGVTRLDVADAIIAALGQVKAPAFGFVNGGFEPENPQSPIVLAHWRAAGLPLGNHTFTHLNLDENSAEAFLAQVDRNESVIAPLMQGQDWHWFRYPYLAEGDTPAKRDAVRLGLAKRGYRIAAVTQDFADYEWNTVYAGCAARGDAARLVALEESYLAAARDAAIGERDLSRRLLHRDLPQVLLMHLGAFDARVIRRLLDQYRALGFRFVSLAEAERDPFYRAATDPRLPGPSPSLDDKAINAGIPVPTVTAPPKAQCQ